MTLFDDAVAPGGPTAPLAARMRPRTLDEIVGQDDVLAAGSPMRLLLAGAESTPGSSNSTVSVILWGPPGTGKTTLAMLASRAGGRDFRELSAVSAGVREVREVIEHARQTQAMQGRGTDLFIDEVHRFSKSQQDALLPAVENGWVRLIAATTENPSFSVISPLMSRSVLITLQPVSEAALVELIHRATGDPRGLGGRVAVTEEAVEHLARIAQGDARRALTLLEAAASGLDPGGIVDLDRVSVAAQRPAMRYDKDGDQHYDVISAFIKSVRGSDPDAALHYLARMLEAGEDPRFIARRLMILASEDIGLADSGILTLAVSAAQSVALVGMPEARIMIAHVTIAAALAPKSNAVITAVDSALRDVHRGRIGQVPRWLRDAHYPGAAALGHGTEYQYPHDLPEGVAPQHYLPDELAGVQYYRPSAHGAEARLTEVADRIRKLRAPE